MCLASVRSDLIPSGAMRSHHSAQVLLGAQQDRLTEEARKISQTVEQLREKLRKVLQNIGHFGSGER